MENNFSKKPPRRLKPGCSPLGVKLEYISQKQAIDDYNDTYNAMGLQKERFIIDDGSVYPPYTDNNASFSDGSESDPKNNILCEFPAVCDDYDDTDVLKYPLKKIGDYYHFHEGSAHVAAVDISRLMAANIQLTEIDKFADGLAITSAMYNELLNTNIPEERIIRTCLFSALFARKIGAFKGLIDKNRLVIERLDGSCGMKTNVYINNCPTLQLDYNVIRDHLDLVINWIDPEILKSNEEFLDTMVTPLVRR